MRDEKHYESIGFKCGLEIHQRLATESKLFCSCSAQMPSDVSVEEIERRQRAVAGELGKVDPSAVFESARARKFVYNAFSKSACLVDIDEEPPHELNPEALDIAMLISASLGMKIPAEIETMRKEVVDGSDPSAFQRTMLVGYNGRMRVGKKDLAIPTVFLEEESSGIERSDKEIVLYNIDRLGVPLIEIDTDPDIKTPDEAKEVARRIGLLLRITGRVQRGIGSIRQDVNISIRGGTRVEIKGFQELETMDVIIDREIERHQKLIELAGALHKRKAKVHNSEEVTDIFKSTKAKLLRQSLDGGGVAIAARLEGFEGLLGQEVNPDRRLGSEISDYAKMGGVGGIIHSDENLARYELSDAEVSALNERLGLKKGDAFILVTGPAEACSTAIKYALIRAELAFDGVPKETRGADGKRLITTFMRPLPGGSRMYPETDVKPIVTDEKAYAQLKSRVVDPDNLLKELEADIGNKQLASQMLWSPYLPLFKEMVDKTKVSGSVIAPILLEKTKELRRSGVAVDRIGADAFARIFERYGHGEITKAAIGEVIKAAPASADEVDRAIKANKLERISGTELKSIIHKLGNKGKDELMRELMSKYRLNVDGEELRSLLDKR
ncbi:Glutamyl-tRNA(Gln) amidotransferase subunit E [uncultured archaeon]|nr:Glutamyl-tRNA(Gln) amidotransferase subunit E [uncultured archaeon]